MSKSFAVSCRPACCGFFSSSSMLIKNLSQSFSSTEKVCGCSSNMKPNFIPFFICMSFLVVLLTRIVLSEGFNTTTHATTPPCFTFLGVDKLGLSRGSGNISMGILASLPFLTIILPLLLTDRCWR
ncbi:Undecaprenyl phosphate-alpha-4-amino-4-deoxy-L-arabinose arabinosyl transferase [Frankliniella fusca]|uniref:Undecaprenyl phosphate-alpha-4-amino-4-deoxy-L-arabinose arabinosyl transferase n=1 Tax=Frankliniella fusca TaxID=407009 RepID=A0AAE1GT94_9NEOP|nr:Undecaprenyl phosphate-alpha-4-amino-4-deoxy-L-arabinose arabinosyl transferase [Frankliniella fusca]